MNDLQFKDLTENLEKINFGEVIKDILLFKSDEAYDNIFMYKKIVIITSQTITFTPIDEFDEIKVSVKNNVEDFKGASFISFSKFNNQKLQEIWKCQNSQGYFDKFTVGVEYLRPSFIILCELGTLGVYDLPISTNFK